METWGKKSVSRNVQNGSSYFLFELIKISALRKLVFCKIVVVIFFIIVACHCSAVFAQPPIYIENNTLYIDAVNKKLESRLDIAKYKVAIDCLSKQIATFLMENPEQIHAKGICNWLPKDSKLRDRRSWFDSSVLEIEKSMLNLFIDDHVQLRKMVKEFFDKKLDYKQIGHWVNNSEDISGKLARFLTTHSDNLVVEGTEAWFKPGKRAGLVSGLALVTFVNKNFDEQYSTANIDDWLGQDLILKIRIAAFLKGNKKPIYGVVIKNWQRDINVLIEIFNLFFSRENANELDNLIITSNVTEQNSDFISLLTLKLNEYFSGRLWQLQSTIKDGALILYNKKHLYLNDQNLVFDGAEMSSPKLDEQTAKKIVEFLNKNQAVISKLTLKKVMLTDEGMLVLYNSLYNKHNVQLKSLAIIGCGIDAKSYGLAAMKISELIINNPTLIDIQFYNNTISKVDFSTVVGALSEKSSLEKIDLTGSVIDKDGLILLKETIEKNRNLKFLTLTDCVITVIDLFELALVCREHINVHVYTDKTAFEEQGFSLIDPKGREAFRIITERNRIIQAILGMSSVTNSEIDMGKVYGALIYGTEDDIEAVLGLSEILPSQGFYYIKNIRQLEKALLAILVERLKEIEATPIPLLAPSARRQRLQQTILSGDDGFELIGLSQQVIPMNLDSMVRSDSVTVAAATSISSSNSNSSDISGPIPRDCRLEEVLEFLERGENGDFKQVSRLDEITNFIESESMIMPPSGTTSSFSETSLLSVQSGSMPNATLLNGSVVNQIFMPSLRETK